MIYTAARQKSRRLQAPAGACSLLLFCLAAVYIMVVIYSVYWCKYNTVFVLLNEFDNF